MQRPFNKLQVTLLCVTCWVLRLRRQPRVGDVSISRACRENVLASCFGFPSLLPFLVHEGWRASMSYGFGAGYS